MLALRVDPPREEAPGASAALGTFAGFALLALTSVVCIAIGVPRAPGGLGLRVAHDAFEIACTLGLGALSALAIGAWVRVVATPWWASATVFAAACAPIQFAMLGNDFERQASVALDGRFATAIFLAFMILAAASVPAAHVVGSWLSRWKWLRWLPIVVAVAAMVANHFVLADDYFGSHGAVSRNGERMAWFGPQGSISTPVIDRSALTGNWSNGPLIVEEYEGTTVVPPGARARVDGLSNIVIELL